MSRAKKIDPEKAIQAAMALFWQHGYNGLGTRQLEDQTGITRFTLQTSYSGKKSFFLSALDTYLDTFEALASPSMTDGSLDTIADWFIARTSPAEFADVACYGCLMLNSTVEFAAQDEDINQRAERFFVMVRNGFRCALTAVKKTGKVADDFDVDAMAEVCLSAAIGLNIVIRSAADNAAGKKMAQSIAVMVHSWAK